MNITMIGLGKLGLPVAEVMAQHHTVRGYDISPNIRSDVINIKWSMIEACAEADIIFVAVPTPHDAQYSVGVFHQLAQASTKSSAVFHIG